MPTLHYDKDEIDALIAAIPAGPPGPPGPPGGGGGGSGRTVLTADLDYYIHPGSGDDANPGTFGAPMKSPVQAYIDAQRKYDLGGRFKVRANLLANATGQAWTFQGPLVGGVGDDDFKVMGPVWSLTAITVTGPASGIAFQTQYGASVSCEWMTCIPGNNGGCWTANRSRMNVRNVATQTRGSGVIMSATGPTAELIVSEMQLNGVSGQSVERVGICEEGGRIIYNYTWSLQSNPTWTIAFIEAALNGVIDVAGSSYSGSGTGSRYRALQGGRISTGGSGGANFLPGNSAGTIPDGQGSYQ